MTRESVSSASVGPTASVAVAPDSRFTYVASREHNEVSAFTINPANGALALVDTIGAGTTPAAIAVEPSGRFVYEANVGSNDVWSYSVNQATGALTSVGSPVAAGDYPASIAVNPKHPFVLVASVNSSQLHAYVINADGSLTPTGPAVGTLINPRSIAIENSGRFAYVAEGASIVVYSIDPATGEVTPTDSSVLAGGRPSSLAMHPDGKFLYAGNSTDMNVGVYSIDSTTGALTLMSTSIPLSDTSDSGGGDFVTLDPTGRFAYVIEIAFAYNPRNTRRPFLSLFTLDPASGAMTFSTSMPLTAASLATARTVTGSVQ